jgi:hypothetical protein
MLNSLQCEFSGAILACFVEGGYAGNYEVESSDLDLVLVYAGAFDEELEKRIWEIIQPYCNDSPIILDILLGSENFLYPPESLLNIRLLYGKDIRSNLKMMTVPDWTRDRMHDSCGLISHLFGRPGYIRYPLGFPNPDAEYFGYNDRLVRLPDGTEQLGTKNILRASGWAATALIAWRVGQYVTSKTECLEMYRQHIDDEWTAHIEILHTKCRGEWKYLIPEAQEDQVELQNICRRNLEFENHFLLIYKKFLMSELSKGEAKYRLWALDSYCRGPYIDDEVCSTIAGLQEHENMQIRQRATDAVECIQEFIKN